MDKNADGSQAGEVELMRRSQWKPAALAASFPGPPDSSGKKTGKANPPTTANEGR
jgi:hypothetical protein